MKGGEYSVYIVVCLVFVSMAGWMFGGDTGTISGIINMQDFICRFGDVTNSDGTCGWTNARLGLVVGLVNVGGFLGCLISSPVSLRLGKRRSIQIWCLVYLVGIALQISASESWVHLIIGRIITGLGFGALSVIAPGYQSETSPKKMRATIVTTYQLFVTAGILVGYVINNGTKDKSGTAAWRIPIGVNFLWGIILAVGMIFLPESPAHLVKIGKHEEAKKALAKIMATDVGSEGVTERYEELRIEAEHEMAGGKTRWIDILGPRVRYRTFLGMAVMSFQQLVGANFFFYYGTSVFSDVDITGPFIAQIILGAVNFGCTFGGLYILEHYGRRKPLIYGAAWMFVCFMIFASVGNYKLFSDVSVTSSEAPVGNRSAGITLIVFACLYIFAFSMTWAPGAYVIVGESYPLNVRSKCAAVATACSYFWNFLIAFFTSFIVEAIGYKYGYIFASCCFIAGFIIYFFAYETKGLTIDQIDEMYTNGEVKAWNSESYNERVKNEEKPPMQSSKPALPAGAMDGSSAMAAVA